MIGGEFDLSAGVAVTTSALTAAMLSYQLTVNVWVGVIVALIVSLAVGAFNGWLLIRTGLPSFLVTLGTFLILQGSNLARHQAVHRQRGAATPSPTWTASTRPRASSPPSSASAASTSRSRSCTGWCSPRSPPGSCCAPGSATGSSPSAATRTPPARSVSPSTSPRSPCSWASASGAWFVGMHLLFSFNTVQSGEGVGNEFLYIIAAVIGGCLLTGGYGSAIGPVIGAFIFGMVSQGIVYANWNPDWFKAFLGVMLLSPPSSTCGSAAKRPGGDRMTTNDTTTQRHAHRGQRPRTPRRSSNCATPASPTATSAPCTASTSRSTPARSPASSATTAPASPPSSRSSPGCTSTPRATSSSTASPCASPPRARPWTPGIATVYQDLAVVPLMPVWRNFFLGSEMTRAPGPSAASTSRG